MTPPTLYWRETILWKFQWKKFYHFFPLSETSSTLESPAGSWLCRLPCQSVLHTQVSSFSYVFWEIFKTYPKEMLSWPLGFYWFQWQEKEITKWKSQSRSGLHTIACFSPASEVVFFSTSAAQTWTQFFSKAGTLSQNNEFQPQIRGEKSYLCEILLKCGEGIFKS